jgi:hypothetical protein
MATVFFFGKLKPGADAQAYENWVREYDYPTGAAKAKSLKFYRAYRVKEESKAALPYDYVEHIDITSKEDYEHDMAQPWFKELIAQWSNFMDNEKMLMIYADVIE